MTNRCLFKRLMILSTSTWFLIMVVLPFMFMFLMSLSLDGSNTLWSTQWTLIHLTELFDPLYAHIAWQSLFFSVMTTGVCLLIGYPVALALTQIPSRWKPLCLSLLMIPFWSSSLVRIYALMTLLKAKGLINSLLMHLGVVHLPLPLLYNNAAVIIGQVYTLIPFMILPLYALLEKHDRCWVEAARDLGASEWQIFWRVFWPYSMPAVGNGILCVFLPAMTLFYIPTLLGGRGSLVLGNVISEQILTQDDWSGGAATSVLLTLFLLVLIALYQWCFRNKEGESA